MLFSREIPRTVASNRSKRSVTTASGTVHSAGMRSAGVPSRIENLNMNASLNRTSRHSDNVSSNSASVSPGKPTMISVVSASPGMALRSRSTLAR